MDKKELDPAAGMSLALALFALHLKQHTQVDKMTADDACHRLSFCCGSVGRATQKNGSSNSVKSFPQLWNMCVVHSMRVKTKGEGSLMMTMATTRKSDASCCMIMTGHGNTSDMIVLDRNQCSLTNSLKKHSDLPRAK